MTWQQVFPDTINNLINSRSSWGKHPENLVKIQFHACVMAIKYPQTLRPKILKSIAMVTFVSGYPPKT